MIDFAWETGRKPRGRRRERKAGRDQATKEQAVMMAREVRSQVENTSVAGEREEKAKAREDEPREKILGKDLEVLALGRRREDEEIVQEQSTGTGDIRRIVLTRIEECGASEKGKKGGFVMRWERPVVVRKQDWEAEGIEACGLPVVSVVQREEKQRGGGGAARAMQDMRKKGGGSMKTGEKKKGDRKVADTKEKGKARP